MATTWIASQSEGVVMAAEIVSMGTSAIFRPVQNRDTDCASRAQGTKDDMIFMHRAAVKMNLLSRLVAASSGLLSSSQLTDAIWHSHSTTHTTHNTHTQC